MEKGLAYSILEINETKDEDEIKAAYRRLLSTVNPEEDQAGFMRLREAYEEAVRLCSEDDDKEDDTKDPYEELKDGSEVDRFIYKIHLLYSDLKRRTDPASWEEVLSDDITESIDNEMEISDRILIYISNHHYMPKECWQVLDRKFDYSERTEELSEKFPPDFLSYVNYKINNDEFIRFDLIDNADENTDEFIDSYLSAKFGIDTYINEGLQRMAHDKITDHTPDDEEEKSRKEFDQKTIDEIRSNLNKAYGYGIDYPFLDVEKIRFLNAVNEEKEEVLSICESLLFEYEDINYIASHCAEILYKNGDKDKAREICQKVLEDKDDFYPAKLTMSKILFDEGDLEDSKEYCLDLIDEDDRNLYLRVLLDQINDKYIVYLENELKEKVYDFEIINKLAWCYFQLQDYDKTEEILLTVKDEDTEKYDYINLRGRNFLALDEYEKALKYLPKWHEEIVKCDEIELSDDERKKRKNRLGFSEFAIGYSLWKSGEPDKAVEYLLDSIEHEDITNAKVSYMDNLMELYIELKENEKAFKIADEIIDIDPSYYPTYLKRLNLAFEIHDGQQVINDYYECIRLYPYYAKPYVLAFKVFYYGRQYKDCMSVYEKAMENKIESDELTLFYFKYRRLTEDDMEKIPALLNEFSEFKSKAEERYDKKEENEKKDKKGKKSGGDELDKESITDLEDPTELYLELAILNWDDKNTDRSLTVIDECEKKYGVDKGMTTLRADILYDRKEYKKAAEAFKAVVSMGDPYADLYIRLGKSYEYSGEIYKAMLEYENAYRLDKGHPEVNYCLMRVNKKLYLDDRIGNAACFDKALNYINAQIELSEDDYDKVYYIIEKGILNENAERLSDALDDYLKAASINPANIYAHNNAGLISIRLRDFETGISEFNKALACDNSRHEVWVNAGLGDLYEAMGNIEKAIEHTMSELSFHPDSFALNDDLARRYMKNKNYRWARDVYLDIFKKNKISAFKFYHKVAETYFDEGDLKNAEKYYKRAFDEVFLYPGSYGVNEKQTICSMFGDFYYRTMKDNKSYKMYLKGLYLARENKNSYDEAMRSYDIAQLFYESGKRDKAKEYAKFFLDYMVNWRGTLENAVISAGSYAKSRAVKITYALIIMGDLQNAYPLLKFVNDACPCKECYDCPGILCHESYLIQALIAEYKGEYALSYELAMKGMAISRPITCHDLERLIDRLKKRGFKEIK